MKAPDKIYVEVCEDGIFAFPEPPFAESVEYIRADINKQPVEGLEEAAKQYAVLPMDVGEGKVCIDRKLESAFKAGAKWQAEQGVTAIGHFSGCWIDNRKWYSDTIQLHKDVEICEEWLEDKVQIQIRKKDE